MFKQKLGSSTTAMALDPTRATNLPDTFISIKNTSKLIDCEHVNFYKIRIGCTVNLSICHIYYISKSQRSKVLMKKKNSQ